MLRNKLAARGARGIIGLQRVFKILDDNGDGTLEIQEFWKGLTDFRIKMSQDECRRLFDLFDVNDDGVVDFDELIQAIKGDLNPARKEIIKRAFNKMDQNGNGILEVDDIRQSYNAANHPDVKAKKKTEDEILQEFLETFEAHRALSKGDATSKKGDRKVTLNEFMDYYSNISASIDDDEYF
jgi:Ca2+-binding EF-hand superfamily protein